MNNKTPFFCSCIALLLLISIPCTLRASYYPIEVFTNNGIYSDSPVINIYFDVLQSDIDSANFIFYNESLVPCSVARIYFDSEPLADFMEILAGPETSFSQFASPSDLPSGNNLEPAFETANDLCVKADPSPAKNGINPGQWVQITAEFKNGFTYGELISQLDTTEMRIGAHIIALPDGSSESAVNVPEPATIGLLVFGGVAALRKIRTKVQTPPAKQLN